MHKSKSNRFYILTLMKTDPLKLQSLFVLYKLTTKFPTLHTHPPADLPRQPKPLLFLLTFQVPPKNPEVTVVLRGRLPSSLVSCRVPGRRFLVPQRLIVSGLPGTFSGLGRESSSSHPLTPDFSFSTSARREGNGPGEQE